MREPDADGPLRIALLSPCYWPEVRRGTERFVRDLADGLLMRGHHPTLITSHPGLPRRSVENGLPVIRLPRPPQGPLLRMGFEAYLTHIPLTYLVLIAGSYDLAHAVYPTDALAAVRWGRRTGRPSLLSYMGIPTDRWLRSHRLRRKVLLRAVHGSDAVVALSRHAAEAFHQSVDHDPEVIPPGVDLRAFRPLAARAERPTVVCSAAADVPRKNVGLLVGAFELVRAERPDARLVLSNPRDPQAVRHAGVDLRAGGIEWATLDDRDTLARAYGEAWVAVLPSMDEAFGLVLVEALACGTPVVGYAHGGIPEVIDRPQIGELFSSMDAGGLARALLDALELAPDPRTATYCRARAEELSAERCVDSYVALYRKLLASSS